MIVDKGLGLTSSSVVDVGTEREFAEDFVKLALYFDQTLIEDKGGVTEFIDFGFTDGRQEKHSTGNALLKKSSP